jgi:hypothetical protein
VFRPVSAEHASDESWPGLLMLRVEGRVFFANAQRVGDIIRHILAHVPHKKLPPPKVKLPKRGKRGGYREPDYQYKYVQERY